LWEQIVMTSAWKEPPGRDDCAEGQDVAPDENQLELFETLPRASTEAIVPSEPDLPRGEAQGAGRPAETTAGEASARDFPDVGGVESGSDELRRLEDSIRWLMTESSVRRMPAAEALWPVRGLPRVASLEDDSLLLDPDTLLNPDTLFPPQRPRGRGSVFRGAAKMLLVSAVAAPTAYFIATWMQFTGFATPTDPATVSDSATSSGAAAAPGLSQQRLAAAPRAQARPSAAATQAGEDVSPQPGSMARREMPRVETSPEVTADAGAAEPIGAREPSPDVSAAPSDPAPNAGGLSSVGGAQPDTPPATEPAKPALNPQEIAVLVERGRALFEAGDVAAARLFFRRAANAGDAAAAVAMGATYDPDVLAKRFIRGIEPDAQEARAWYEKALLLGSPEGPRRIEMLAQRQAQ
jgi:TPR repeat protein